MNFNREVDAFMEQLEHPFKAEFQRVREIILSADERMTEVIKWSGPTFIYQGNLATLTPRTKKFVNLYFQTGAKIPDTSGLLEGDAKEVRVARFYSMEDVEQKAASLQVVVQAWIHLKDGE